MMRALFALAICALAWIGAAPPARALNCLLGCNCTVAASDITFDDFNPLIAAPQNAVGAITVQCTGVLSVGGGVDVEVLQGEWGAYSARKLRSDAGDMINYNIYTTSAYANVWGAGAQSVHVNGGILIPLLGAWNVSRDMHARILPNSAMKPGIYRDNVVVRVIW